MTVKIRISAFIFAVAVVAAIATAAAGAGEPTIRDFSSTGGKTVNKTGPKDTMYLVSPGDKIVFTIKADGTDDYVWQVNKAVQDGAGGESFAWTVPDEKGIWEIHVQAGGEYHELEKSTPKIKSIRQDGVKRHKWGGAHKEWVVSTLSPDEAPVFFDYFADMKTTGRSDTDPWGRKLPAWTQKVPDVSEGFARGPAGASAESTTAFGTWRFKYKFIDPFFHQVGGYVGYHYIMNGRFEQYYLYGENMDTHHHCEITDKARGMDFSIEYDGAGTWSDGEWYEVTIVRTRDGHVYAFRNGILEMHAIEPLPESSETVYLQLREPVNARLTGLPPTRGPVAVDCLEIYKDKYLFPISGVEYRSYVTNMKPDEWKHRPVKQKGIVVIGRGIRLGDIAKKNRREIFQKDRRKYIYLLYESDRQRRRGTYHQR